MKRLKSLEENSEKEVKIVNGKLTIKAGTTRTQISILFYNINGVQNKFEEKKLINIFNAHDLLIITETHFKTKYKSPDGFVCIRHSKPLNTNSKGRGGVIIYKKRKFSIRVLKETDVFDFINRADLINQLMLKGAGKRFVQTITSMYDTTTYKPKIDTNNVGDSITTCYGVTQGRKTSANFFTFVVDDMPSALLIKDELFQEIQLLQLADDTALPNSLLEQLKISFEELIDYSTRKFMHINFDKTHYLHMSKFNHITEDSNP